MHTYREKVYLRGVGRARNEVSVGRIYILGLEEPGGKLLQGHYFLLSWSIWGWVVPFDE